MRDPRNTLILALSIGCAFMAGALVARPGAALAQQTTGTTPEGNVASNNRMIAATGSVGSGMSVLWLVDSENKRLLIYGTNNMGKNLELRAARNIEWDLRLDEYHDESQYKAEDLRRLAERQQKPPRGGAPEEGSEGGGK